VNTAASGLELYNKTALSNPLNQLVNNAATFEFHLDFCPLASGTRSAVVTITYNTSTTFTFTVNGTGTPSGFPTMTEASTTWSKIWGGYSSSQDELPGAMVVDGSGNMYFSGNSTAISSDATYGDIFVARVNLDGSLEWQKVYHTSYKDDQPCPGQNGETGGSANSLAIGSDGNIYLVGRTGNGANNCFLSLIMQINATTGAANWTKYWTPDNTRYNTYTDLNEPYAVTVTDTTVFVTGAAYDYTASKQGLFVANLDLSGNLRWSKLINPNGNSAIDRGYALKVDGTNLYVGGYQGESTGSAFLCKLAVSDAVATLTWARNFTIGTGCNFNSIDADASGNIYLAADRRGATTYFSFLRVSADGATIVGKTYPGSSGDRNNTHVVKINGNNLYVGGRLGNANLDTTGGDGLLLSVSTLDLSLNWAGIYYSGNGVAEQGEQHFKGIAIQNSTLYTYGLFYTGNGNHYRYYGYWLNGTDALQDWSPGNSDVTGTTTIADISKAGLVGGTTPAGTYETITGGVNVEFQNADAKNQNTNGANTDADVTVMKMTLN
jgi:hypothetical protein